MSYKKISGLPDEKLREMVENQQDYEQEAILLAKQELERRRVEYIAPICENNEEPTTITQDIIQIKSSVNTIKNIMLFYVIVSIISAVSAIFWIMTNLY